MITEAWVKRFESMPIDSQANIWSKLSKADKTKVRALAKTLKKERRAVDMALTLTELKEITSKAGPSDFFASSVIEALGFRVEVLPNDQGLFVGSIEEYRGGYSRAYYIYEVDFETGRVVIAGPHRSYSTLKLAKEGLKYHTKEKTKLNA